MLKTRCKRFIDELGINKTKFCQKIGFSTMTYYKWQKGELEISQRLQDKINDYLSKYGF